MADMSNGKGNRLMGMIPKHNWGRVVPGDTDCIAAQSSSLGLMQLPYELLDHYIHTLQVLDLQQAATPVSTPARKCVNVTGPTQKFFEFYIETLVLPE